MDDGSISRSLLENDHALDIEFVEGHGAGAKDRTGQHVAFARAWRSSDMQLFVLDHDMHVVLWSQGMAKATGGFVPSTGSSFDALPFPTVEELQATMETLQSILSEGDVETIRDPVFALQAAVVARTNVTVHLVTQMLGIGSNCDVLLSMTATKMSPLPKDLMAGLGLAVEDSCHLLVLGHEQIDPGLLSLIGDGGGGLGSGGIGNGGGNGIGGGLGGERGDYADEARSYSDLTSSDSGHDNGRIWDNTSGSNDTTATSDTMPRSNEDIMNHAGGGGGGSGVTDGGLALRPGDTSTRDSGSTSSSGSSPGPQTAGFLSLSGDGRSGDVSNVS